MTTPAPARWQRPGVADALGLALLVVWSLGSWLGLARPDDVRHLNWTDLLWGAALSLPFAIVGFLLARRVPANPIGWLFLIGPLLAMSGVMVFEIINHLQEATPSFIPFVSDAVFFMGIGLMAGLFLLLFPAGRLPSPRWRWVVVLVVAGLVISAAWSLGRSCIAWVLSPQGDGDGIPSCTVDPEPWFLVFESPLDLASITGAGAWDLVGAVGSGLVIFGFFAGVASLFVRYRTGSRVERAQLRWLLALLVVITPGFGAMILADVVFGLEAEALSSVLFIGAVTGIPVVIGLAIVKFRLYDLDRLISRTITYALVVALLAMFYGLATIAPVLMLGAGEGGEPPSWLVALSTLGAFALFARVRRRVQAVVDRRFDRSRYDAARVLEGLGTRVRDSTSLDEVATEVVGAVHKVLRPGSLSIWFGGP